MDNNQEQDILCLETMALKAHLVGDLRRHILHDQDIHNNNLRRDVMVQEAHNNRHHKVVLLNHRDHMVEVQCNHAVTLLTLTCNKVNRNNVHLCNPNTADTHLSNDNQDNLGATHLVQVPMGLHKGRAHTVGLVKDPVKCNNGDLHHSNKANHHHSNSNRDRLLILGRTLDSLGISKLTMLVQKKTRVLSLLEAPKFKYSHSRIGPSQSLQAVVVATQNSSLIGEAVVK